MKPYNCTRPGNLFVGYERLRQELLNGFQNGNSYAILGGRRCGKTSFLIQIEKDLHREGLISFHPLPRRFSMQELGQLTPELLFETIYRLVIHGVEAEPWKPSKPGREYQHFLNHLDRVHGVLNEKYGSDWLVILLIDEMDVALSTLPDDQFFQNLRNFLMESRFHRHFRVLATGVKDMARLISSGSSPLNNLRNKYLGILRNREARQLVSVGFSDEYDTDFLFKLTGKHPFLLQGILEKLWQGEWDKRTIRKAAKDFLREHKDFHHWINAFGTGERVVYRCLAEAPQGTMHIMEIKNRVDDSVGLDIDEALTVLSYHGVIDDSDPDEPEIAGTLFREWFLSKTTVEKTDPGTPEPYEPERPVPSPSTAISIQVSPTIMGASIQQGFTPEEVFKLLGIFEELKSELSKLSVDERTKMKAQHALDEAAIELKEPESGATPDTTKIKSSVEKATGILKSTSVMADSLSAFIEKALKLAPYLGQTAGWLSTLL